MLAVRHRLSPRYAMKLNPDALEVESFPTAASDAALSPIRPDTGTPTAATFCEFCGSDSGCW
jgi:hypothetical protein